MTSAVLTFHDTTFTPVIRNNQPWLTAVEIAQALGYAQETPLVDCTVKIKRNLLPR